MLVSILITSHNYARYLPAAIDSALGQSYGEVEVIVVDDGSTDDSAAVIRSYGDRVHGVVKANDGQTSALNTGFEQSRGEVICLLDADDMFEPDKVERVVGALRATPTAYLVHHQLQLVDEAGTPVHAPFPRYLPTGDLRERVIRSGGWFPHPVSSGLSFRRSYAERLFPLPLEHPAHVDGDGRRRRTIPDTYLAGPSALLAPVAGVSAPLSRYRMHDRNASRRSAAEQLRNYEAEIATLSWTMRERFGESLPLRVEDHFEHRMLRCSLGMSSRARTAAWVMTAPAIPIGIRFREALRVVARRGLSATSG